MKTTSIALAMSGIAVAPAAASVLAFQDFEGNSLASTQMNTAATIGTSAGTFKDSGLGLNWSSSWTGTGYLASPSSDGSANLVGVTNSSNTNQNGLATSGNAGNWFHAGDTDGLLTLSLDPIDTAGHAGLALSFDWATAADSYDDLSSFTDSFRVTVNGDTVFEMVGDDLDTPAFGAAPAFSNSFITELIDLSAYDGQVLDIAFEFMTNSLGEQFGLDNILLTTSIPLPGAGLMALAGLAGIAGTRRRA